MMRYLMILVAIALASCAGQVQVAVEQPASAGLPAVADLDRMAANSEAGGGEEGGETGWLKSDGVQWFEDDFPHWLMTVSAPCGMEWIITRISDLPIHENLQYVLAGQDNAYPLSGSIWSAVADFSRGTWVWQDNSQLGWYEGYPDAYFVGHTLAGVGQPISPDGSLYVATIAWDAGAMVHVSDWCQVFWEFDEPFLQAPVLEPISAGQYIQYQCGADAEHPFAKTLYFWRCAGEWDPAAAVSLSGPGLDPPGEVHHWQAPTAGLEAGVTYFYAATLGAGNTGATPPASPYSNIESAEYQP